MFKFIAFYFFHLIIFLCCTNFCYCQHWWNYDEYENIQDRPLFTPKPEQRYTHSARNLQIPQEPNDVIVTVPKAGYGTYVGFSQRVFYDYTWTSWPPVPGKKVNVFLGIPYAAQPLKELRFKKSIPAYLDPKYMWFAKSYKPACMQMRSGIEKNYPMSEDCLYLNIFYPNRTWEYQNILYPVVIHFHGGSFVYGASHQYPGHALASMGLVVVTFNYRLGPFGFLATGDFEAPGNYGLWDQLLAIRWVRDNIKWFHGDPTKITLMGESAGAASVGLMLTSPVTIDADLFHRAILMSGSELSSWAVADPDTNVKTRVYVDKLASLVGCSSNNMHLQILCLRYDVDAQKLLNSSEKITAPHGAPDQVWSPVVDGTAGFLPQHPKKELKLGRVVNVPIMATVVHSEASWLVSSILEGLLHQPITKELSVSDVKKLVHSFVVSRNAYRVNETVDELILRYTWWSNLANSTARLDEVIDLYSDYFIKSPLYESLLLRLKLVPNHQMYFGVWAYRGLNNTRAKEMGIYHGVDLDFLWGFPFMNETFHNELTKFTKGMEYEKRIWNYPFDTNMSEFAMILWSNFIKLGNPTPHEIQNITWLPFQLHDQNYVHLYINSSMHKNYRQSQLAFWRERFDKLAQPLPAMDESRVFPFYEAAKVTIILGVGCALVLIALIVVIVLLCRRPGPEEFKTKVRLKDGDQFNSAFHDRFAGYRPPAHQTESHV